MSQAGLRLEGVTAGYHRTKVLQGIDLEVPAGSVVALLGSNGAGKTTLLRVASGVIRPGAGRVLVGDADLTRAAPSARARAGLCLIPEGRGIFRAMTVRENLLLAVPPWKKDKSLDGALEAFPALRDRLGHPAGRLSGGQQQMVALSRAYLADPSIVMLDEISMGLAPIVVDQIFRSLRALAARGTALLVVEQYVDRALDMCDHVYLLNRGTVAFSGKPAELDHDAVVGGYLGLAADRDQNKPMP